MISAVKRFLALPLLLCVFGHQVHAQEDNALKLGITGHFKMYGNFTDQDENINSGVHKFDILRDVDIGVSGETELDNGWTVGAVINADGDAGDGFNLEDGFVYLSGEYGRFSFGLEDSANFQLQVSAPSADENIDGLETFINPVNWSATTLAGSNFESSASNLGFDYDNDSTSGYDKITYFTPLAGGLQAGASYTPDVTDGSSRGGNGNSLRSDDFYGDAYEIGTRFEREFRTWTMALGAGYTLINLENNTTPGLDDFKEWNGAANIGIDKYSVGAVYTENNGGSSLQADQKTFVLGADYTFGDYRIGASYLNRSVEENGAGTTKADRYTGGLVYEYGPGLSFRGSVSHVNVSAPAAISSDVESTSVLLGTQILF
ncbi:MAG: porin [Micavibrio aeruginosavorus]|uniref:Porin n=1 Tax=Micavibrio aeruginosavorus TaxID=349221 RepID=A0A2W5HV45_9BACT|nr:MAG: porin [Micavibrio aeruginosavorus]